MAAPLVGQEEFAVTLELAIIKPDLVSVVIAVKCEFESAEVKAVGALGITLCLLSFSDHPIVHPLVSFRWRNKKARAQAHALDDLVNLLAVCQYSHSGGSFLY
jgi:hypothetical protein